MKKPMIDTMERPKFDNLYTPREAIMPLIQYIPRWMKIWECTDDGRSNITKVFLESNYSVLQSDILTGFDFLIKDQSEPFGCIVTNPPYSLKDAFLERCYYYGKPFALLLPLTALEGIKRGAMFRKHGISPIILDKRVDFSGGGSNWFNASWFTWGILENNTVVFEQV